MQAWEREKSSPDYQRRREISERLTEERSVLKKAAHAARQELARARKIDGAINNDMRDLQDMSQNDRKCWTTSTLASSLESEMNAMQPLAGIEI